MALKINAALTGDENLRALANTAVLEREFQPGDLHVKSVEAIEPTEENNLANTRAVLEGTPESQWLGQTTVEYIRLSVPDARPTGGTKLAVQDGATHETIRQQIIDNHQFVADQVVFTNPPRVPAGGETMAYTVAAKEGSPIYFPSSLVIQVRNKDPFSARSMEAFFGMPVDEFNDLPVYALVTLPLNAYGAYERSDLAGFAKLMTLSHPYQNVQITERDFVADLPGPYQIEGKPGDTAVLVSPKPGGIFTDTGYVFYRRHGFGYEGFAAAAGYPPSFFDDDASTIHATIAKFYGAPAENVQAAGVGVGVNFSSSNRRVYFRVLDNKYLMHEAATTEFHYFR